MKHFKPQKTIAKLFQRQQTQFMKFSISALKVKQPKKSTRKRWRSYSDFQGRKELDQSQEGGNTGYSKSKKGYKVSRVIKKSMAHAIFSCKWISDSLAKKHLMGGRRGVMAN